MDPVKGDEPTIVTEGVRRLPLEACRRLLGVAGADLADTELATLRDQLYDLAFCVVPTYRLQKPDQEALLQRMPEGDRYQIEERAAVLEFDANMSRSEATKKALASHVEVAKQTKRTKKV